MEGSAESGHSREGHGSAFARQAAHLRLLRVPATATAADPRTNAAASSSARGLPVELVPEPVFGGSGAAVAVPAGGVPLGVGPAGVTVGVGCWRTWEIAVSGALQKVRPASAGSAWEVAMPMS